MKRVMLLILCCQQAFCAGLIRISGSDALGAKVVPLLCEGYKASHPGIRFEVAAEGSFGPLPDFVAGKVDILMVHEAFGAQQVDMIREAGIAVERIYAMTDFFAVAIHFSNPVESLTLGQVEALFTGDHANWKAVGGNDVPVAVYARNTSSSSYRLFQSLVMKQRPYAGQSMKLATGELVSSSIARDPNGITYLGCNHARSKGVKVVRIEGVDPLGRDWKDYPLLRPAYYYIREGARPEVKEFVRWATNSPEADEIVRKNGFLKEDRLQR